MYRRFGEDPFYLSRYYICSTVIFLFAAGFLYSLSDWHFPIGAGLWLLALSPLIVASFTAVAFVTFALIGIVFVNGQGLGLFEVGLIGSGIYFGMVHTALIHNCAHNNFKPRWLNRILGELLATHMLSGYPGFAILHLEHHRFSDDPVKDPHPNLNLSYWQYLNNLKYRLRESFLRMYQERWGESEKFMNMWKHVRILLPLNRVLRAIFILFLFGPQFFALFYLPSYLASQLTYAHVNYYTHAKQADGSVEIINMNHNYLYKFLNFALLGIYMHKDHHRKPNVFNPYWQS